MYLRTTSLQKIQRLEKRLRIIQGGSSAGKTIAILMLLIDRAQRGKLLISIVSETVPHLRRGSVRDFKNIMQAQGDWEDARWNETNFIYTFETGAQIEFFSADKPDKVRGPRRDILFINEANNVSFATYTQLAIRTNQVIYLDFNPVSEFWAHTELTNTERDFIVLTYKDNEALPQAIVQEIESRRDNKQFWRVYGEGLIGEAEGKIFKGWLRIEELPHEAQLERYGLDFGYSNDPTALIAIYRYNGGYILDEIAYTKGLSNKQIADILSNEPRALVIADSAEPKSIDEIRSYGVNILPARKGKDSINSGIQLVQAQRISYTGRSLNLEKEYRNYMWLTDSEGRIINEASPIWNHAVDAIRYGFASILDFIPETVRHQQDNHFERVKERQAMNSSR